MGKSRRICFPVIMGTVAVFLAGCNGPPVREPSSAYRTLEDPGIVAVVPFFERQPDKTGRRVVRCPRCEGYMTVGEIAPEGSHVITGLFRRNLIRDGYTLASQEMIEEVLPTLRNLEEMPEVLARELALELRVDSVLFGWIFQYRERIGGDWGAQRPASVAFVSLLFDGKNGRLLWRAKFDETQKPLSEDVLRLPSFLRRGGRWVTASELASDGVGRILLTFPGRDVVKVNP